MSKNEKNKIIEDEDVDDEEEDDDIEDGDIEDEDDYDPYAEYEEGNVRDGISNPALIDDEFDLGASFIPIDANENTKLKRLIGRIPYDSKNSPVPHMTMDVTPGDEVY